jgi:hypothetical protein
MILRSITKHVRDQNWFAVGIDFIIVIVGVFIGIQVANWNEAQSERRILNHQLSSLHAEFTENLNRFDRYGQRLNAKIDDIQTLRSLIAGLPHDGQDEALDRMLMNVFSVAVFTADRTTLDELKDSGKLRQLRDIGIRQPLVEWEEAFAGLRRLEGDTIAFRNTQFTPFAMDQLGFGAMGENYAATQTMIAPSPFRNDIAMLEGNRKFDNIIVLMLGPTAACLEFLEALRNQTRIVLERLEEQGISS